MGCGSSKADSNIAVPVPITDDKPQTNDKSIVEIVKGTKNAIIMVFAEMFELQCKGFNTLKPGADEVTFRSNLEVFVKNAHTRASDATDLSYLDDIKDEQMKKEYEDVVSSFRNGALRLPFYTHDERRTVDIVKQLFPLVASLELKARRAVFDAPDADLKALIYGWTNANSKGERGMMMTQQAHKAVHDEIERLFLELVAANGYSELFNSVVTWMGCVCELRITHWTDLFDLIRKTTLNGMAPVTAHEQEIYAKFSQL